MSKIASIKASTDIVELIGGHVELKKSGNEYKACCPFHEEKTPSFFVYPDTQRFHCFGCKAGGDCIDFIELYSGLSTSQAIDQIDNTIKIEGPKKRPAREIIDPYEGFNPILPPADEKISVGDLVEVYNPKADEDKKIWKVKVEYCHEYPSGYVLRTKIKGKKVFATIQWCEHDAHTGWCSIPFSDPRPLYKHIDGSRKQLVIVEGEKTCDYVQSIAGESVDVITWHGGTGAIKKTDWRKIIDRKIIICPDADEPGMEAAMYIYGFLLKDNISIDIMMPPPNVGHTWDLADESFKNSKELFQFIRSNIQKKTSEEKTNKLIDQVVEASQADDDDDEEEPKKGKGDFLKQITPLGYDNGSFYYWSKSQGQVAELSPAGHQKLNLLRLACYNWWMSFCPGGENSVNWTNAANILMRQCEQKGIFDPAKIRGRGCWLENKELVVHLGDRIATQNGEEKIEDFKTDYIYESARRMKGPNLEPLGDDESKKIVDIAKRFSWERPASAALLCGWVALAPLCGALKWRPHIWITGGTGTGKSTIMDDFIKHLTAGSALHAQGNSTEAGIRQTLKSDAMPVLLDEAEQNEENEQRRVQNVLALMRQASSDGQAKTVKGTAGGSSMSFMVRSMFCLASIQVGIKYQADHTRISVLSLQSGGKVEDWETTRDMLLEINSDPEYGSKLMRRSIKNFSTIKENIKTFIKASARHFKSQRLGDQYGTLLAGCYSLISSNLASDEQAENFVKKFDWESYTEDATEDESLKAINSILQIITTVESEKRESLNLGEIMQIARSKVYYEGIHANDCSNVLMRNGLKIEKDRLLIANKHDILSRKLQGKPWSIDWKNYISRIDGAEKTTNTKRFGLYVSKAVSLPLAMFD